MSASRAGAPPALAAAAAAERLPVPAEVLDLRNDPRAPDFSDLPEDALICIFSLLPSISLRACAVTNKAWSRALERAPEPVRRRAYWLHQWTAAGAGASIQPPDSTVCSGGGTWHPGGVALASTLQLSTQADAGFRLVVDGASAGDLLVGITLLHGAVAKPAAAGTACAVDAPRSAALGADTSPPLEMGYEYMLVPGQQIWASGLLYYIQKHNRPSNPAAGKGKVSHLERIGSAHCRDSEGSSATAC